MNLIIWIFLLFLGLIALSISSDKFIGVAEQIGLYFKLPPFVIGVVIIGFGTSLPELASSIVSVLHHSSEIVISNAIGSNITNIFLVLGVSALFSQSYKIDHDIFKADIPFLLGSAILISLMTYDLSFSLIEAFICLLGLGLYLFYSVRSGSISEDLKDDKEESHSINWKTWLILIISPLLISYSADLTIKSVIKISQILKIGADIVALTAVSLGTSLPEVMVSIQAARKGKGEIAVGNVIGSNIFNTFAVMGVSALFGTLKISQTYRTTTLPFFLGATFMLFFILKDKKVFRFEGILLLIFYVYFILSSFQLA